MTTGNLNECVDWLMWITTPEHDEMVVNEVPSFIPANKKARALPEVENMFVGETRLTAGWGHTWPSITGWSNPFPTWLGGSGSKFSDIYGREMALYLMGDQDLDTFLANLEKAAADEVPDLIRKSAIQYSKDGAWDLTQWACQPKV